MTEQNDIYKHCDSDDSFITLHDCYANRIAFENGILSFYFEDGFWITSEHKSNNLQKTVRTDSSRVDFHLEQFDSEEITVYVFQKSLFGKTIRKELKLNDLVAFVNDGTYSLEFLYQYKGSNEQIIECWLHFDKRPYDYECQLKIPARKTVYHWNDLRADREW